MRLLEPGLALSEKPTYIEYTHEEDRMKKCDFEMSCPDLYEEEPGGDFIAVGKKLEDGAITRCPVGEDEVASRIPREVVANGVKALRTEMAKDAWRLLCLLKNYGDGNRWFRRTVPYENLQKPWIVDAIEAFEEKHGEIPEADDEAVMALVREGKSPFDGN